MRPETYIDLASNDPFGKKVPAVKYPLYINFSYNKYEKHVRVIKSFIYDNTSKVYIVIVNRGISNRNIVLSKLIKLIKLNKRKNTNIFVEYIVYRNALSYFPKIWYNGKVYVELMEKNIIYGYINIIYVDYDFIKLKKYNKYNAIVI